MESDEEDVVVHMRAGGEESESELELEQAPPEAAPKLLSRLKRAGDVVSAPAEEEEALEADEDEPVCALAFVSGPAGLTRTSSLHAGCCSVGRRGRRGCGQRRGRQRGGGGGGRGGGRGGSPGTACG